MLLNNKTKSCNAFEVLRQNGFTPNGKCEWESNWNKGSETVKLAHPIWNGEKVQVNIISK